MIRPVSRQSKSPRKKILLVVLLVVLVIIALIKINPLKITNVQVQAFSSDCLNNLNPQTDLKLQGQNILLVNEGAEKNKILNKYPCVADINIEKTGIGSVKVTLTPRIPLAYVTSLPATPIVLPDLTEATPSSTTALVKLVDWSFSSNEIDRSLVIDKAGWVFKQNNQLPFPELFVAGGNIKIGSSLSSEVMGKVELALAKLPEAGVLTAGLKLKMEDEGLFVSSSPKLIFSVKKDILRQLISLQLILQKAKIDEKVVETIDLRFDKPVITYAVKKAHG